MPAYIVFTRFRTKEPSELDSYRKLVSKSFTGRQIKTLAAYGPHEVLEGPGVEGMVILEFPTMAEAKAWYNSPTYKEARAHRFLGSDYGVIVVEGAK